MEHMRTSSFFFMIIKNFFNMNSSFDLIIRQGAYFYLVSVVCTNGCIASNIDSCTLYKITGCYDVEIILVLYIHIFNSKLPSLCDVEVLIGRLPPVLIWVERGMNKRYTGIQVQSNNINRPSRYNIQSF